MVSKEEIDQILSGSYKWIKVPKYKLSEDKYLTLKTTKTNLPGMEGVDIIVSYPQIIKENSYKDETK